MQLIKERLQKDWKHCNNAFNDAELSIGFFFHKYVYEKNCISIELMMQEF